MTMQLPCQASIWSRCLKGAFKHLDQLSEIGTTWPFEVFTRYFPGYIIRGHFGCTPRHENAQKVFKIVQNSLCEMPQSAQLSTKFVILKQRTICLLPICVILLGNIACDYFINYTL